MGDKNGNREFWDTVLRLLRALRDAHGEPAHNEEDLPGRIGEANITGLLGTLAGADEETRASSAWMLNTIRELILSGGSPKAVPELLDSLKHADPGVRRAAIRVTGWIGDAQAITHLLESLNTDSEPTVRREIAEALGKIGHPSAIADLLKSTDDPQEMVRYTAVWALGRIGDRQAVPALVSRLKDESRNVRRVAARALGWIGDTSAVPGLIETLKDESSGVRRDAARALGKIKITSAVPDLAAALKDNRPMVRCAAAEALGMIGDASSAPSLIDALSDLDSSVRRAAARALGAIRDPRAVTALLEAIRGAQSSGSDTDIYSLGTSLYESLTSSLPIEAQEIGTPSRYIDPITTMMSPEDFRIEPEERPSAREQPPQAQTISGKQSRTPARVSTQHAMLTAEPDIQIPIVEQMTVFGRGKADSPVHPDIDLRKYGFEMVGTVSRQHCQILHSGEHYYLEDLNSRNGTFINREKLKPERMYRINEGDMILIGRIALEFHISETA